MRASQLRCALAVLILFVSYEALAVNLAGAANQIQTQAAIIQSVMSNQGMYAISGQRRTQESAAVNSEAEEQDFVIEMDKCGVSLETLPQDFSGFMSSLECRFPASNSRVREGFCDCIRRVSRAYTMSDRSKSFDTQVSRVSDKMLSLANTHYFRKWMEEFRINQRSMGQLAASAGNVGEEVTRYCHPQIFDAALAELQKEKDADCNKEQLNSFQSALNREIAQQGHSAASGSSSSVSAFAQAIGSGLQPRERENNCLTVNEAQILRLVPRSSGRQGDRGAQLLPGVEQRLRDAIRDLESKRESFLSDPQEFDFNRRSQSDPMLGEIVRTVPSAQAAFTHFARPGKYEFNKPSPTPLTREERAANYQALLSYLKSVQGLYKNISATISSSGGTPDVRPRLLRAFAEFNNSTQSKLMSSAKNEDLYSFATAQCQGLTRDLRKIACSKPPLKNMALLNSIISGASDNERSPLVTSKECGDNGRNSNGNADTKERCLLMGEAVCRASGSPQASMNFEVLSDIERFQANVRDWEGQREREIEQLQQEYCSELANWSKRPGARCHNKQGADLMYCLQDRETHQSFAGQFPESEIAHYFRESYVINAETNGGLAGVTSEARPRDRYRDLSDLASAFRGAEGITGSFAQSTTAEGGNFISSFTNAAANLAQTPVSVAQSGAAGQLPVISPPEIRRRVAEKTDEINAKDEELAQLGQELARAETPEQKSTVSAQIAQLQSELEKLRSERAGLEGQLQNQIAAKRAQDDERPKESNATVRRSRAPASSGAEFEGSSSGFSTGAGSVGATSSVSGQAASGASVSMGTGPSLGAARSASTVQELNALPASAERALMIQGTSVPTGAVVSIQVANASDLKNVEQVIAAQREKLRFNDEGWATVEIIDQATKQVVYMKVRLEDQKLIVEKLPQGDQQGIQKQVRAWAASYQNLLRNLRDSGKRSPAEAPNRERQ